MTTYRQSWRQRILNIYIIQIFAISCAKNSVYCMENSSVIWLITAIEQFLHFVNCDVRPLFSRQLFFGCCSAHARPREHAASQNSCSSAVVEHAAIASKERPCWEARHALTAVEAVLTLENKEPPGTRGSIEQLSSLSQPLCRPFW